MTPIDLQHRPRSENTINPSPRLVARCTPSVAFSTRAENPGRRASTWHQCTPIAPPAHVKVAASVFCVNGRCRRAPPHSTEPGFPPRDGVGYASSARSMTTCSGLTAMRSPVSISTSQANCMIEPRAASRIIRSTSRAAPSTRNTLPPTTVSSVAGGTYCLLLPAPTRGSPRVAPAGGVLGNQADI